jgi:methylmalonyl-CoA/ethylmalonyl-CoA epimerase
MPDKPEFKETLQIGIVVRDLEESMRKHWELYGIGPWEVTTLASPDLRDTEKDDEPVHYGMRIALTMVGSVQWELIQPIDDNSIYADFLRERGEGLHHVLLGVDDYEQTLNRIRVRAPVAMSGNIKDIAKYAYLPSEVDLGYTLEIHEAADGADLEGLLTPEEIYPPAGD